MNGLNLENSKKLVKFDVVRQHVAEQHSLKNPDLIIEMSKLRITPELDVEIPTLGTFAMTDWSKKQIGQLLGVSWSRWFNPALVDRQTIQDEIQKRFSKMGNHQKNTN